MNRKEYVHLFSIHPDCEKREFEVWLIDDRTIDVEVYEPQSYRRQRQYRNVSLSTVKRLSDLASAI